MYSFVKVPCDFNPRPWEAEVWKALNLLHLRDANSIAVNITVNKGETVPPVGKLGHMCFLLGRPRLLV